MVELWGRRSSINVQKVLWALDEAKVEFRRHVVGGQFGGLGDKDYRRLNPNGLVPAIRDGSLVLFESNAIVRYLARRYGKDGLRPSGQKAWALTDQWMDWSMSSLNPAMSAVFMNTVRAPQGQGDAAAVKKGEADLARLWKIANRGLGRKPWLAGRRFSCADIPLGAHFWRYSNLDIKRPALPNLERWFAQLQERPAYRQWVMVPLGRHLAEWTAIEKDLG